MEIRTCPHLAPLERELAAQGVTLGEGGESPYGADGDVWFPVDCTFDEPALRKRLQLADCVSYDEYDGRVAGSDATFYCDQCHRAIWGLHPRYASPKTKRLS